MFGGLQSFTPHNDGNNVMIWENALATATKTAKPAQHGDTPMMVVTSTQTVIKEVPFKRDGHHSTIGRYIDGLISDALMSGGTVSEINVDLSSCWESIRTSAELGDYEN
jgi:hypothetical protein